MFLLEWIREYRLDKLEYKAAKSKVQRDDMSCDSCKTLEMQLALANQREKDLLERLINPAPAPVATTSTETFKPITGRHPFEVKRRELEANSRREAEIIKQRNIELEQLEKEMQIRVEVASESDYEKVNEVK